MNLTEALKKWAVENCEVKADASDDEFKKAIGEALATGILTADKFAELSSEPKEKEANEFGKKLDALLDGFGKLADALTKESKEEPKEKAAEPKEEPKEKAAEPKEKKEESSRMAKMLATMPVTNVDPDGKDISVRVKEAIERYDTTKTALLYPMHTKEGKPHSLAGRQVVDFSERGRAMDTLSDRDKAVSGAFAKWLCASAQRGSSRTAGFNALPQHDKEIMLWAMENMDWVGSDDGGDFANIKGRLTPRQQKDLIDDATSGGLEAAPIVFDDDVIQAPLLNGELYPLVKVVPLERGRRVEGVSVGTVTGAWGGVDATAITLFNTAAYVAAFDTTIYRWEGAIRIGLDFLSDTPIDFGAIVSAQYGERLLEDLDDVIAVGNGTTQPQGIMNAAGTTTVAWGGATSIGNYESLRFSVAKNEHTPAVKPSAVFCGTETSYQRMKALAIGTADARRLFAGGSTNVGMYDDYSMMQRPYKINESLTNQQIFYAILARYRMYRRRGLTMRSSTEGDTLIRRNEMLMVATARFGGQIERGACAAITTTAPA